LGSVESGRGNLGPRADAITRAQSTSS